MSNNKSTRRQNKPSYKANIKPLQKDLNTGEQKNKNQIVQTNSRFMLTDFLPTTKKEVELREWDELDVILFSGDAYIDHPAFGVSVIGRVLEAAGYRVAIIPQPDWHGDFRDFKKLGRPRLFFGVSAGAMDSMVTYVLNTLLLYIQIFFDNFIQMFLLYWVELKLHCVVLLIMIIGKTVFVKVCCAILVLIL